MTIRIAEETREKIRADYRTGQYTYATLGKKYGISGTSVGRILNPDYEDREREKNRIRQRSYSHPRPAYSVNLRFSDKEQTMIDHIKSVYNIQQYIKNLIAADMKKRKKP